MRAGKLHVLLAIRGLTMKSLRELLIVVLSAATLFASQNLAF